MTDMDFQEVSATSQLPKQPMLSVLMITFNHEKYLSQAIDGVISQQVNFPIELIISDDCSTDQTRSVAIHYQSKYPALIRVVYSEKNVGPNKNFSRTLSLCRGRYVAICDGDDVWVDVTKLQKQVGFLESNSGVVICYHDYDTIDETGHVISRSNVPKGFRRDYTAYELQTGAFTSSLTRCFRNVVRSLPDEWFRVLNSDRFFITLLGEHGTGHYMHDLAPGMYRHHTAGIWSKLDHNEKKAELCLTYFWLIVYYHRVGRSDLVNDFVAKMLTEIAVVVPFDSSFLIKFACLRIVRSWVKSIRTHILAPLKMLLKK